MRKVSIKLYLLVFLSLNLMASPTFQSVITAGSASYGFELIDIDGDGDLDAVGDSGGYPKVYEQNPIGTFTLVQTLSSTDTGLSGIYGMGKGDLNGDGRDDLLTAGPNGDTESPNMVFLNQNGADTTNSFYDENKSLYNLLGVAFYGQQVVTAELNGDTNLDAVWLESDIRVALGSGDGNFSSINTISLNKSLADSDRPEIVDMDGDGDLDIVIHGYGLSNSTYNGAIYIELNDGVGNFTEVEINSSNASGFTFDNLNAVALAVGDYNNDGKEDIVFFNYGQLSGVDDSELMLGLRTSANGATPTYSFSSILDWTTGTTSAPRSIVSGDIDKDGNIDLVLANGDGGQLLLGSGDGTFIDASVDLGTSLWIETRVEDINNDGYLDIAFQGASSIKIYLQIPPVKLNQKAHSGVVQFDGVSYIKHDSIITTSTDNITIEAWVNYQGSTGNNQIVVYNGDTGSSGYGFYIDTTDTLTVLSGGEGNWSAGTLTVGKWNHIAFTISGGIGQAYVNGATSGNSFSTTPTTPTGKFTIASNGIGTENFKGMIDEVCVWNIARTSAEINSTINKQLDGNESGLVAYYNFDETLGAKVVDSAGGDNNGTVEGNVTRLNFLGDGLSFDGVDDVVVISNDDGSTSNMYALDGNITLGAWIKVDGLYSTTYSEVISRYGNSNGYILRIDNSNGIVQMVNRSSDIEHNISSTKAVTDNLWHYVVATYDGETQKIYIDGVENNSSYIGTNAIGASTGTLTFGATSGLINELKGNIAEVSIWNRALSELEIKNYMHIPLFGSESGLIGYWALNEGEGNITYDKSSYGNDGNISGAEWNTTSPTIYGNNLYTHNYYPKRVKLNLENNVSTPTLTIPQSPINGVVELNSSLREYIYTPTNLIDDSFIINVNDGLTEQNITVNVKTREIIQTVTLNINLKDTNLNEHNVTNIQIYGVDGIDENLSIPDITSIVDGDNNYSVPIFYPENNFSIRVDINNSGVIENWYYNFNDLKLYLDNNLSSEFKTEINSTSNLFTIDLNSSNWSYYEFGGNLFENDKNVTDLMLINSSNGLVYETNLSEGATSFDINFSTIGEYNLTLVTDKNQTWYYNFTIGEINSTYIASSIILNESNLSVDLNLSKMNFDDYSPPTSIFINFNNTSDLTSKFNSDSTPTFTNIATGGIDNSGVVSISSTDDIWTYKEGISISNNIGDVYTISGYFYISGNSGYGSIGFAVSNQNEDGTSTSPTPNTTLGVGFHGGGGSFVNDTAENALTWNDCPGDCIDVSNWYKLVFTMEVVASNTYNLKFEIWDTNSTGELEYLAKRERILNNVVNTTLGSATTIYPYFGNTGSRLGNMDNYNVTSYSTNSYSRVNLLDTNLSENNITSIRLYGVDGNSEDIYIYKYGEIRTIIDGENNYSFPVNNLDNNFSLEINVSKSGVSTDWFYNFSNGVLYSENNLSSEFKQEINSTDNNFTIDMNASNWIILEPLFNASSTSLVFNDIEEYTTTTLPLSITNIGNFSGIVEFSLTTTNFAITPTSCNLNIGESCQVNVTFSPPTASNYTDTLSIYNSIKGVTQTLAISGSAYSTYVPDISTDPIVEEPTVEEPTDTPIEDVVNQEFIDNIDINFNIDEPINLSEGGDLGDLGEVTENVDGSKTFDIKYDTGTKVEVKASIEVGKDGKSTSKISIIDESGNSIETSVDLPEGTETILTEDGSIEQSLKSESGTETKVKTSPKGEVDVKFKSADGKNIGLKAPLGSKTSVNKDGSLSQNLETKEVKAEIKAGVDGKTEVKVENSDGDKVGLELEVEAETELKSDGSVVQKMESSDGRKSEVQASKRAEVKAVIESPNGESLQLNPPKGANVKVNADNSISITNQTMTNDGFVNSEMKVNSDGSSSVDVTIDGNARGVASKKLTYSTRKDISNAKLEVILDERTELSRTLKTTASKGGRVKATFSTRKEFSYKSSNLRELENFNVDIEPSVDAIFEENLYFNEKSDLKLSSGKANIKGVFSTRNAFNSKNRVDISDKLQSTRRSFSIKADKSVIENSGMVSASLSEEATTTTITTDSEDMQASIFTLNKNYRDIRGKVTGKKLIYSVRKSFSDVKLEVIEDTNLRSQKAKLKVTYSTRSAFSYKSSNLRDIGEITIIPSEDANFTEEIYKDGKRIVTLISGSATINDREMLLNIPYLLPSLEAIEVSESVNIKQDITLKLKKGWNLISSPIKEDISDKFIFGNYDVIWNYKNARWYKNPNMIYYNEGLWIKSNINQDVNFSGDSYIPNLKVIPTKWALVGVGENIENIEEFLSENRVREIYLYKDNNWSNSDNLQIVEVGSGLWIEKEEPNYLLNLIKGWNLVSLPTSEVVSDMSIFGDYDYIIIYKNSEWVKNPEAINPMEGFWIKMNENLKIAFYGESYKLDSSLLSDGWSLVGGDIDNLNENEILWLFKNSQWMEITSNKLDLIQVGDGIWIRK